MQKTMKMKNEFFSQIDGRLFQIKMEKPFSTWTFSSPLQVQLKSEEVKSLAEDLERERESSVALKKKRSDNSNDRIIEGLRVELGLSRFKLIEAEENRREIAQRVKATQLKTRPFA